MAPSISVTEFYAGKTIFITGATGFMGKVLVEKLLRCCPDLKGMYLLMRPKRGLNTEERLNGFVKCQIFDHLQDKYPKSLDKVHVIKGDILQDELGISTHDWDMLQREVQIVFHCAADVRFDMSIREAVNANTMGTMKVLKLAEGMKKLEVFLHISTSFCRCEVEVLEERLYPSKDDPLNIIQCVKWMDNNLLNDIQFKLIAPQPNTYAYTKSLSEDLISQHAGKFPIVIARPSIVTASYKEPMPGWVDNLHGYTGIYVGGAKGVIRTMHCNKDYLADLVPVDMAVNACIVLSYITALEKPKEVRFCNITQSGQNPITWGQTLELGLAHLQEFPFSVCLWYPGGSLKTSRPYHLLAVFFTHLLPAYFIDLLLFLMGKKPFMVKVQKRVNSGLEVLRYYTTKKWFFENNYYRSLRNQISKADDETFYTDIERVHWSSYMRNYVKGAREYCCKEDPATLLQARRLHKRLYYVDKAAQIMFYAIIAYFIYILGFLVNLYSYVTF